MWREASRTVDAIEGRIPGIVLSRHENAEARLASVSYQIHALQFGEADRDSVRALVEGLVQDYPYGDYAPAGLFEMARCEERLGNVDEAHHDLARLVRDYPTAPVVPEAQLLRARLFVRDGDWRSARRTLRALPLEFPTSDAALRAPLEIASHYRNNGDVAGEQEALVRAERRYREILERYPRGEHSYAVREKLVNVHELQGRNRQAIEDLLAMCDEVARPAQRPALLFAAARRAELHLTEPARAATIYRRLADEFPDTRLGKAAVRELHRFTDTQGK
jgi:tetratricopeptide (TPR) repeat protein